LASNPITEKKTTARKAAEKYLGRVMDYKRVFKTEQGQRVLHDLMKEHFIMSPTYQKGDSMELAYKEGQRNVVLRILEVMDTDPQAIIKYIEGASNADE
jgi:hypothetical protein